MKRIIYYFCFIFIFVIGTADAVVISRIDVSGNRRMDAESVRLLSGVKSGQNITNTDANDIAKKLQQSGYFSSVSATIAGDTLKISVVESAVIDQITIEGNDEISTDDLKKEIRLKPRETFDPTIIGADVSRILTLYQRKGFFGTRVNPQKIDAGNGRINVVYEITEGHPTYIKDIKFKGNKHFSSRTLRGEIMSREHAWWKFMASFDVYDEDRIQYDAQLLRQFYMRSGYADVMVRVLNGSFSANREYYSVVFGVDEGARYEFGKIKITNPFSDVDTDDLYDSIKFNSGDIYNTDKIDESIIAMRGIIAEAGYSFINIDPMVTKNDRTRTIDLDFRVIKTNRIYLDSINILGNVRTFDSVVEHQMGVRAGDPFSLQNIETGRQRMMRSQYYKDVQMVPTRVAGTDLMNLDVKITEQPTGELSGGIGWSSLNGFMIDAGITENNFMGRGQIVQLKGSIAQYTRQVLASFTEPYMFGRELSGGVDINYTMYNYGSLGGYGYDRDSVSVAGRMGWRLTDHWTQGIRLAAMFDQNYDLNSADGWKRADLYSFGTSFKYHNLDTDFKQNTHTGVVANLGATYTGFGISTEEFMRYNADITGLVNFLDNRWQLRSSLEFGMIQTMNDDDYISRVYRYFLGGESFRGFDIAGVGSRNWAYRNYALGGMWKANGSTQLNFPIFIPDEYQVKGFIFADYGILGKPPSRENEFTLEYPKGTFNTRPNLIDADLRTSVGVGVYWNTPMGPMNFSWGWPLRLNEYDREQRFLLSFETQF
ncbi:MAG: outer membrane protein assembly factor BamA [Rickettsiales bacterium]|jgi:outer membrane protein insertion porin family|nr:outer membrane protein assembly factor BamA [Rickettsiales bacterium]